MNHTVTIDREAVEDALFFSPINGIIQDHIHSLNEVCFWGIINPKSMEPMISDSTVAVWHILHGDELRDVYLRDADLRGADAKPIKADLWDVLLKAIPEIPNLKKSLVEGKVDGSTYDGECSCLCGTLEKSDNKKLSKIIFDQRDSSRPIERLFLGIKKGDTPETNPVSKIVMEWICEFEGYINAGVPS